MDTGHLTAQNYKSVSKQAEIINKRGSSSKRTWHSSRMPCATRLEAMASHCPLRLQRLPSFASTLWSCTQSVNSWKHPHNLFLDTVGLFFFSPFYFVLREIGFLTTYPRATSPRTPCLRRFPGALERLGRNSGSTTVVVIEGGVWGHVCTGIGWQQKKPPVPDPLPPPKKPEPGNCSLRGLPVLRNLLGPSRINENNWIDSCEWVWRFEK